MIINDDFSLIQSALISCSICYKLRSVTGLAENDVVALLGAFGPALTSRLAERMRGVGVSPEAARQRLSRLPESVRVLHGLPFPKRARFIYLRSQFNTSPYWTALIRDITQANPAYAAALAGVKARGGILPRAHFDVASGSPALQKKQVASATVLARLISVGLLSRVNVEGAGECVALGEDAAGITSERASMHARLMTEDVLIGATCSWLGRMNWASPTATTVRGETMPKFATFHFDICGPCYLRPMRRFRGEKVDPGFVVADVVLGRILEEDEVKPFIRKCETLSYLRDIRPFLPMLIADGFSPEALRACRAQGIVATRPETLFGRDVGQALSDLLQTLQRAGAVAASNPKKLESLFARLGSIEGAATNLRGALFELIVGHLVRAIEGGSIDIGDVVQDIESNQQREIDVRLVKERKIIIYECKGYQPGTVVQRGEIERWLNDKVPVIRRAHQQQPRFDGSAIRFEFWTCGIFDQDALALLEETQSQARRFEIAWRDGTAIREYAKGMKAKGIRKILNDHYFSHPLADLAVLPLRGKGGVIRGRARVAPRPGRPQRDLEDLEVVENLPIMETAHVDLEDS
jgi:hypothetical protein